MRYFYILGTVCFTLYGQLILKWRLTRYGSLPELFYDKVIFLFKLFLDPFILSGFAGALISSVFWMAAMTKFELSQAYPIILGGLAILTSFFAILLLKESFGLLKIIGILIIIIGIIILNKG